MYVHTPSVPLASDLKGLILAGGHSTRFGSDKALAIWPESSGKTRLLLAWEQLNTLSGIVSVAVSCRKAQEASFRHILPSSVSLIFDAPDDCKVPTPLHGIRAALHDLDAPLLVIPCDLPYMRNDLLGLLIEARRGALKKRKKPLRTSFVHADGVIESLIAIYEPESLPFLEKGLATGCLGLYSIIPHERQLLVSSPEETAFMNMNSKESLQEDASKPRKHWCS